MKNIFMKAIRSVCNIISDIRGEVRSPKDYGFRTPKDSEYDSRIALHIRRNTVHTMTEKQLTKSWIYEIGGMKYRINSIFMTDAKRTIDDNIRHLLADELDKAL